MGTFSVVTRCAGLAVTAAVLLGGCSPAAPKPPAEPTAEPAPAMTTVTAEPADAVTAVPGSGPAAAIATSRVLFASAPVVVVAAGDLSSQLAGAGVAVALEIPLFSAVGGALPELTGELDRLGTTCVLAFGAVPGSLGDEERTVIPLPSDVGAVSKALGRELAPSTVADGEELTVVSALQPGSAHFLLSESAVRAPTATPTAAPGSHPAVPTVRPGVRRTDSAALITGDPGNLAALATARAAGLAAVLTPRIMTDLLSSNAVLTALGSAKPKHVIVVGAAFGSMTDLTWQVALAASGQRLPGGGALWFPGHTLVAIYGTPGAPVLGILGEQGMPESIQRAKMMAAALRPYTDTTLVPTFEVIATVAAAQAGDDGDFSNEIDPAELEPWVDAAAKAGVYVILDLQPGRSDFLSQAKQYRSLLSKPNVGLALDPEWRLQPGQFPLRQIGSVDASEVNSVIDWLADLTSSHGLPQKILVLHQFQVRMIQHRSAVDTSRAELAIVIHADGQGSQPAKQATWNALHQDAPSGVAWGWKNFIDEDHPMLTPQQTMTQVAPVPSLISYQ